MVMENEEDVEEEIEEEMLVTLPTLAKLSFLLPFFFHSVSAKNFL
jgi:hypothetical protein